MSPIKPHPMSIRICHWLNVIAIFLMVTSGWRIYNASPIFSVVFPKSITIGGWLGGAILWHFAAMWLFAVSLLCYVVINLQSGRFSRQFLPIRPRQLLADLKDALQLKLQHADLSEYNAVQKLAYITVVVAMLLAFLSGLAIWDATQFDALNVIMGGFDNARVVHFFAMVIIVGFVLVHVMMVALVPATLRSMGFALPKRARAIFARQE